MKLIVVTPTLGDSPWLRETIESVAAHPALHVLASPGSRMTEIQARYPALRVVSDTGDGMYGAINAALAAVPDWDAFTYINDDDLLLPDFALVRQTIERRGGPAIAYGGVRLIDAHGRRLGAIPISSNPEGNRALYEQRIEPVYQHGTVVSRAIYDKIGGFDASFRFCGDSEFLARACLAGVPFVCATRREVAAFRLRPGQLTKSRAAMVAERHRVDEKLNLRTGRIGLAHRLARWRFRLANALIYVERISRHGFISFDELLQRAGRDGP